MTLLRRVRWQAVVAALIVLPVALVLAPWVFRFVGPIPTGPGIYAWATLPEDIKVCDRDWHRSLGLDVRPLAIARAEAQVEPVVVDPRPFAPCPPGPCTRVAGGPCHTVIWVRVAQDGYVPYSLRGGP